MVDLYQLLDAKRLGAAGNRICRHLLSPSALGSADRPVCRAYFLDLPQAFTSSNTVFAHRSHAHTVAYFSNEH